MVVEVGWAGTTAEKAAKPFPGDSGQPTLTAGKRIRGSREPFGDGNGAAIGKLTLILLEATSQGQARNFKSVFQAIEFFFFNGEYERGLVEQCNRGATTQGGDAENAHGRSYRRAPVTVR